MTANSKLQLLLRVLGRDPVEFYDRVRTVLEVRFEHWRIEPSRLAPADQTDALRRLEEEFATSIGPILQEKPLREVEENVSKRFGQLNHDRPFQLFHNGDSVLARTCYVACRILQPDVVLETGVAYGVTSAFLLQALQVNQKGKLFSIDLPPLGRNGDLYVGALIPDELKDRWQLFRGPTRRLMPQLLPRLERVDMFVHDSLHTYRNMKREFEQVWPQLKPGGVLIADDVEGNRAFEEFSETVRPILSVMLAEGNKNSLFGLMVKKQ
ncbi:MAG TPA: class I SAM-dependent methyltransferase [Candidatus Acidoferrales bacterium]|nr:class I SAM-dependent methyltransferase [Candidatus Acidoferrales bacterium]